MISYFPKRNLFLLEYNTRHVVSLYLLLHGSKGQRKATDHLLLLALSTERDQAGRLHSTLQSSSVARRKSSGSRKIVRWQRDGLLHSSAFSLARFSSKRAGVLYPSSDSPCSYSLCGWNVEFGSLCEQRATRWLTDWQQPLGRTVVSWRTGK